MLSKMLEAKDGEGGLDNDELAETMAPALWHQPR